MKISNNCHPSFGMSLHMPPRDFIAREVGQYAMEQAEKARPQLEKIASNVDIYINPRNYEGDFSGPRIFTVLGTSTNDRVGIIRKIFSVIANQVRKQEISTDTENLSEKLVRAAEQQKQKVLKSN